MTTSIFLTHAVIVLTSWMMSDGWCPYYSKPLLFDMLCCVSMNMATLWHIAIAVCHFLSTVTQVSNNIISLLHAVTHGEKNDQGLHCLTSKSSTYLLLLFCSHNNPTLTAAWSKTGHSGSVLHINICCSRSTVILTLSLHFFSWFQCF